MKLPSKKIQALIIIIIALFISYFVYTMNFGSAVASWIKGITEKPRYDASLEAVTYEGVSYQSDLDTDSDGLKDWQEALWGTNKNDPDTDGDGKNDGTEIEEGRDPTIPGPNDRLEDTRGISASSVASFSAGVSQDPNNVTSNLSKGLFAQFMSLDASGELTDTSQENLINSVISNIDPGAIPPKYTISDVKVVPNSQTSLKAYGNSIASALTALQSRVGGQSDNQKALAEYQGLMETLSNLQVPSTLGLNHLRVLNNFNVTYQSMIMVVAYENDPVKALLAMKTLDSSNADARVLFTNIAKEMKNNGIIFNQSEAGNIWNNY